MTELILLAKISNDNQLKQIDKALKFSLGGLDIDAVVLGAISGGWVRISLTGEDEMVAINYLTQEIGVCPISLENIGTSSVLKGYIVNLGKNSEKLLVDVGIFEPQIIHAIIPLHNLQDTLVNRRFISLWKIAMLFGFCDGFPLSVSVTDLNKHARHINAELSSNQIEKYEVWRDSLLDRLLILGSSIQDINAIIEHEALERDIVEEESLGMLEHSLSCKLGTDAVGLMPKIGRYLKSAKFSVFSPKKLMAFLKS
jgi:hypothetical protein